MNKLFKFSLFLFIVNFIFTFSLNIYAITNQSLDNKLSHEIELTQSVPEKTIFSQSDIRTTQKVWIEMISNAKNSIDLGTFYIDNKKGKAMEPVINAILNAANKGVKVRIILDSSFHSLYPHEADDFEGVKNIEVRYLPINNSLGGIMHAKYIIVDSENIYVGSANSSWVELSQIHNIGIRILNKNIAATILRVFNLDWQFCKTGNFLGNRKLLYKIYSKLPVTALQPQTVKIGNDTAIVHPAFSPKQIVPSGLDIEQEQLIKIFKNAQKEVVMQVMTYTPQKKYGVVGYWAAFDNAIRDTASRGVHIKFIVSDWNNIKPNIDYIKSLALTPNVEIKISTIPQLKNKFIPYSRVEHCKYFVVDNNLSWIGTGNWEWSYFHTTRDITIIINSTKIAKQLKNVFLKDWNGPYTKSINISKEYKKPKVQ
jgi:phospholipase D3/4